MTTTCKTAILPKILPVRGDPTHLPYVDFMYLKHLELQGYKSFARKTQFAFDHGITAVVGPNGTGKSNIADAVRWALGETRMSRLRASVTDDLIFHGSDSRARLGMAQVAMTLDNSDETLPIDYSEVTIERRAYRDGQSEYLINGTKVRLRDITELLAAGGLTRDTYSVIGQGLVDTVLTLRPRERRALIDVAAGIRPLQDKRDRALSRLEETRDNLTRVRDIVAEVAPRLRRLEKQAERAHQGAQIAEELAEVLKTWYGYQWHAGQQALREARAAAETARQTLAQRRQSVEVLEARIESRRDREEAQADALSGLREQRAELRGRYEAARRDLAVRQERLSLLQRRREELIQEIDDLQTQRDAQRHQLAQAEATLAQLAEQCSTLETQLASIQEQQATIQQSKVEYEFALKGARRKALEAASTLAENRNRLETLNERQEELARERTDQAHAVGDLEAQIDNRQAALGNAGRRADEHAQTLQELAHQQSTCQASLDQASTRRETLREQADEARRRLERLEARRDALAEMRKADGGDGAGTQSLLDAGELGIIGRVASLIRVPAKYETAIEAALGSNLQAVVVETWADAQQAITWLQVNEAGRATLFVLQGPSESQEPTETDRAGILGTAADLVDYDPAYRSLVQRLLGRIVIVETIAAVPQGPLSSHVFVTLDGTVVHSFGQITGGTIDAKVLRRERLWRELPDQIQAVEAEIGQLSEEQADAGRSVEALTRRLAAIDSNIAQTEAAQAEARRTVETAQRDIETTEREIAWRREVLERREEELHAVQDRVNDIEDGLTQTQALHEDAQRRVESLQAQLSELEADALRDEQSEFEKQLALARRDQQNQQTRQQDLRTALAGVEQQVASKQTQVDSLAAETHELQVHIKTIGEDEHRLADELDALEAEIAPAEDTLRAMRREGRNLEREATRARDLLRQAETDVSEANLDVQRREDRLTALRDKIADDLDLAAVSEALPQQLTLTLDGEREILPAVTQVPEGLERRVNQLRRQLRQVGSASPEIIDEYEATKERYDFLTSQTEDLEEAAADLRAVAGELTEVMTERFEATFSEVAAAFEKYFKKFFGGGEAHLSLAEEDDTSSGSGHNEPGLEIAARPPGKRSQSLALLSGGERALTAVALLFSLLEVSPTPFCVLDEVDAMLDEANVGRFRSTLEELAPETQFIIITHNRGTIQAADTVYGVSMSDESVSQAISLKLDALEPVPA